MLVKNKIFTRRMDDKERKEGGRKHFRPLLPKDVQKDFNAWLSNFDIDMVMGPIEI